MLLFYISPKVSDRKLRMAVEQQGSLDDFIRWLYQPDSNPLITYPFKAALEKGPIDQVKRLLECCDKEQLKCLHYYHQDYPYRLKQIPDAPNILFVKGSGELSPQRSMGIVGTRKMTRYGAEVLREMISELRTMNVHVFSGLAYGVDIEAHKNCLSQEIPTSAVLGHALDQDVLKGNRTHAKALQSKGNLISEFVPGTTTRAINFPMRNRILAGLVDLLMVIESPIKGGSLITAKLANQYNRDVMAVPGNINQLCSQGCNALIRDHKAHIYSNVQDISRLMDWKTDDEHTQLELFSELNPNERSLLDLMAYDNVHLDWLADRLNWPLHQLSLVLLELELKNFISSLGGKRYRRK